MKTAKELWEYLQQIQMQGIDDKPFLDGYLCLSNKQVNDIDKIIKEEHNND